MTSHSPLACQALSAEIWQFLLRKTILYATGHVNRWRWRGSLGGLLPDGFDPESIASQAIAGFLQDSLLPLKPTRKHIIDIQRNLELRVRRHVNRLHHRMENQLVRNAPDLAPYTLDDGEAINIIELIPDPSRQPDTALCEKESLEQFESAKSRFSAEIRDQPRLGALFNLLCGDPQKPRVLACRMKMPVTAVRNLRKKLKRRWRRCFPSAGSCHRLLVLFTRQLP
jgi:hypothetical protein